MKKLVRGLTGTLGAGVAFLLILTVGAQYKLPDTYYIAQGESLQIHSKLPISAEPLQDEVVDAAALDSGSSSSHVALKLLGFIPVKEVQVQVMPEKMVVPGGFPFGIKMFTKGVIVVGMSDIQIGAENINPAKEAGIKIGDVLLSINGNELERNEDVARFVSSCDGGQVQIELQRGDDVMVVSLSPVLSEYEHTYKAGIWVRDSSAGIGTMTYYNPESLGFAGLGHAICDVDTGRMMPLSSGEIVDVNISGVNAGQSGKPGELKGTFVGSSPMGYLQANSEMGIFGFLSSHVFSAEPVPMAHKQDVEPGPATILSTLSGNKPQSFDIEIEKINYSDANQTKNMVIRIVDPKLLTSTGGIVQGMSGSPILQNGKLVGAITHVFVNDPTRGYAVFAENMDNQLNSVENNKNAA